jgi:hypothetical protein
VSERDDGVAADLVAAFRAEQRPAYAAPAATCEGAQSHPIGRHEVFLDRHDPGPLGCDAASSGRLEVVGHGPRHQRLATVARVELHQRIADRTGEFLIFAVTPPRVTTGREEARQIAEITLARLRPVGIDGLVLYDIDDESDRNPNERPFPFLPTMDPAQYLARDLVSLDVPAIVYRAVSKHAEDGLRLWLRAQDPARALSVFVGASSRETTVVTSLSRAYELRTEVQPDLRAWRSRDPRALSMAICFSPTTARKFPTGGHRISPPRGAGLGRSSPW